MWLNIETLVWKRARQVPHVTMLQIAPGEVETGEVDGAEVRARRLHSAATATVVQ